MGDFVSQYQIIDDQATTSKSALILSAIFLYLWSFFDSLDGIHARGRVNATEFGGFLDHFLDAITIFMFYAAIVYAFNLRHIIFILALGLRMLISTTAYIFSSYANYFFNFKIGLTSEQFFCIMLLIISYYFPGDVIIFHFKLKFLKELLDMGGISIMGLAMCSYFILAPLAILKYFLMGKKNLAQVQQK